MNKNFYTYIFIFTSNLERFEITQNALSILTLLKVNIPTLLRQTIL